MNVTSFNKRARLVDGHPLVRQAAKAESEAIKRVYTAAKAIGREEPHWNAVSKAIKKDIAGLGTKQQRAAYTSALKKVTAARKKALKAQKRATAALKKTDMW